MKERQKIFEKLLLALSLLSGILTIFGFVITFLYLPEEHKLLGFKISIALFIIAFFYLFYYWGKKNSQINVDNFTEKHFIDNLLFYFELKKRENANEEIIRLGIALSTPLWLSQNYQTRKKIGQYIYDSAINSKNDNACIKVLIDDLGWTNVELGLYDEAEAKIRLGIQKSLDSSNGYYLAKGYRHLFGINYRKGNLIEAENYLKQAIDFTNKLNQDRKKDELIAEIHFAKSSLEFKKGNLDVSYNEIEIATEKFNHSPDKEWSIKILARKGDILLAQEKVEEAIETYKHGLYDSQKFHLNKQTVVNLIGISKCHLKQGELPKAEECLNKALELAETIGMYHEKQLISEEMQKIKSKQ